VILGSLLLGLALFYADSVGTVFRLFPLPILGVILFFGGMELAASVNGESFGRAERTVLVVTAGVALWNVGAAYLAGLLYHADQRGIVRPVIQAKTLPIFKFVVATVDCRVLLASHATGSKEPVALSTGREATARAPAWSRPPRAPTPA
jgi:hypothetical protein